MRVVAGEIASTRHTKCKKWPAVNSSSGDRGSRESSLPEAAKAIGRQLVRFLIRLPIRGRTRLRRLTRRLLAPHGGVELVRIGPYTLSLDHCYEATRNMAYGCYEVDELKFFREVLKAGDVALDIGANVGYFAAHFGWFVGPDGVVYAFEPAPECRPYLESLVASVKAPNIRHIPKAVSRTSRKGVYYSTAEIINQGFGRIDRKPSQRHVSTEHPVEIVSIDDFCRDEQIDIMRLRVCKIDVEEEELNVLLGMKQIFERGARPIILTEVSVGEDRGDALEMADFLKTFGYRPTRLKRAKPQPVEVQNLPGGMHGNLIWVPGAA